MKIQFKNMTKASGIDLLSAPKQHFSTSKESKVQDDRTFTRNGANVVLECLEREKQAALCFRSACTEAQVVQSEGPQELEHFSGPEMGSFGLSCDRNSV